MDEEGEDEIPFLNRNEESHGLASRGSIDGNKSEEVEDSRRFELYFEIKSESNLRWTKYFWFINLVVSRIQCLLPIVLLRTVIGFSG